MMSMAVEPKVVAEQPVAMVSQEIAADKEIEKEVEMIYADSDKQDSKADQVMASAASSQPSALLQSTINIDAKSPKQVYYDQVALESDEALKIALSSLYDFGFTNFSVNKSLMMKHSDVNIVAETLMTGALSESQFGAIYQK